ncbi:MAG: hypothetical protein Q8K65_05430 [Alphaproteobacteria bacterium]|nr:hypothetical protein [Alphaproteobacteria bacterium]
MDDHRKDFNAAGDKPRQSSGRDARLDAAALGEKVYLGQDAAAFAAAEAAEAGSQLPMLMALAHDARAPNGTSKRLREQFDWLDFWYSHDFVTPLFDGSATGGDRWFENTRMTPRDRDDAFIIKAAIVSDYAASMLPYLLDLGDVDLNTRNDRPVTLAVVLGKPDLLPLLAESGADLFAANAEAFKLARQQNSFDVYTELHATAKNVQRASQKKLMQRTPRGISAADLRAGDDETGLHLAAKAGMVRLLLTQDLLSGMTAADFLKPSQSGATPAGILAALGDYATLFDERIWGRRFDEAEKVFRALDTHDQAQAEGAWRNLTRGRDIAQDIEDLQSRWPRLHLPPKENKPPKPKGPEGAP